MVFYIAFYPGWRHAMRDWSRQRRDYIILPLRGNLTGNQTETLRRQGKFPFCFYLRLFVSICGSFLSILEVSPPTNREKPVYFSSIASKLAGLRDFEKLGYF